MKNLSVILALSAVIEIAQLSPVKANYVNPVLWLTTDASCADIGGLFSESIIEMRKAQTGINKTGVWTNPRDQSRFEVLMAYTFGYAASANATYAQALKHLDDLCGQHPDWGFDYVMRH